MTIIDLSPPVAEALTLVEVKAHLRLDGAEEDPLLLALIVAAREHLEGETGLSLTARAFRLCLDQWPADGILAIPRGPVRAVTAVTVYDAAGMPQPVSLADHLLDGEARPARLWLREVPRPERRMNGIEVEFTAGFGESGTDVPESLKRAMLIHIGAMYAWRGLVSPEMQPAVIPPGYDRLIAPFCRRAL
ncbi:phage head-tail connector protein [Peteryoungia desertarenae]|uniref:Phage head-tail connector protein n=1 Tax=Peteryoungia desertarenae TaxID=1813451 RepID=A0ABX6QN27_9HYPH|nr:head-tail connector protein [Peteryoungia desertarenae]QLF69867.1 phage head-tail connector protein [Peteryoungia desertarenae]